MTLTGFHRLFIAASIALAVVFGLWCLGSPAERPGWAGPAAGAVSFATAAALAVYGVWFHLKLARRR